MKGFDDLASSKHLPPRQRHMVVNFDVVNSKTKRLFRELEAPSPSSQ